jgi:biopolymer transport protein ExbD
MLRFKEREEHLDTELNIVPVIDCFVMLICFLLFTAAFTQLVFLEAKLISNTAAAAEKSRNELDQFRLLVTLEDKGIRLSTSGSKAGGEKNFIPNAGNEFDYKALHHAIIALKTKYPERYALDLEVRTQHQSISYEKVLAAIDAVRHLNDLEFGALRVAQKKQKNLELSDYEAKQIVEDAIAKLAERLQSNETSAQADQKVLFADVALLGSE